MQKILQFFKDKKNLSALLVLCGAISFYMILKHLPELWQFILNIFSVLKPLITAAIIAYLLYPCVSLLERKLFGKMKKEKAAHGLATFFTLLLAASLLALLSVTIFPQLASSVAMLLSNLEGYFDSFRSTVLALEEKLPFLELNLDEFLSSWEGILQSAIQWLIGNADTLLGGAVRFGNGVVNFVIELILAVYMLLDIKNTQQITKRWCRSWMKEERYSRSLELAKRSNRVFLSFLRDNILDSLIVGMANFIFMFIMGMPYPLLISVIVGVTNFIPNFGPIIGAVPSLLIILLISPIDAFWLRILSLVMQFLDGNVLKPLLFNSTTGLSPLWVLTAIIIGGRLFGIIGMIIGIPLLTILSQLLDESISKRLAKRGFNEKGEPLESKAGTKKEEDSICQ